MFGSVDQNPDTSPVVTEVLGKASEVPPGTKKEFKVREKPILVINDNGKFYATSGIYSNGRIRCALHGSCYTVKTGDIEDYPTFGNLPIYEVNLANIK
ncbi:rieske [2Fe-2S] domain protein [Teladorsagia circumcincta]|uniref:Rieske [2Fe-2S] domain protein n=1 Tax=Teladorsagia circumcincta TaxID=45464 RepID=A0A2G9U9U0_TELCI|nr:rieske [2Fe-2S] domain protein [Teladorsagia circumcincta]